MLFGFPFLPFPGGVGFYFGMGLVGGFFVASVWGSLFLLVLW